MKHCELTILMPCLNEERTIAASITEAQGYLTRRGCSGEVLIADNGSTDRSAAIAEEMGARVVHCPEKGYGNALCEKQSETKLLPWIDRHFAVDKLRIADIDSRHLISLCNGSMTVLDSEIKKLSAFCLREGVEQVTREIIDDMVFDRAEYDMYDIGNRIMACDRQGTMRIYYSLKRQQTPPMVLIAGISRAIAGSMIVESGSASGATAEDIEKASGMKSWQQSKVYRGKFPRSVYLEAMEMCLEADLKLKSTKNDEDVMCETLIIRLLELFAPKKS